MTDLESFEIDNADQLVTATDRLLHPPRHVSRSSAPELPPVIPTGVIVRPRAVTGTQLVAYPVVRDRFRFILPSVLISLLLTIGLWIGYTLPH